MTEEDKSVKFEDDEAKDLAEEKPPKRAPDSEQGVDVPEEANTGDAEGLTPSQQSSGEGGASRGGGSGN